MKPARLALALLLLLPLAACEGDRDTGGGRRVDGNIARGHDLIERHACGACHVIPGVHGADGLVGPPLESFSRRSYIAGELPNNAANLERWLLNPPAVEPHTAMPNLGLTPAEARDMAAYLSTLR